MNDDNDEIPWPTAAMSAFHGKPHSTSFRTVAYVDSHASPGVFATNFREAAEALYATIVDGRAVTDMAVCPFVFLWRHYLELQLKSLLPLALRHAGRPPLAGEPNHNLNRYWSQLYPLVMAAAEDRNDRSALRRVHKVILEFDKYDPEAFAFRYGATPDGSPVLLPVPRRLELQSFHAAMLATANYLEAVEASMLNDLQLAAEFGP